MFFFVWPVGGGLICNSHEILLGGSLLILVDGSWCLFFFVFFFGGWWLAWGCGPVGKGALKVGVPGGRLVGGG